MGLLGINGLDGAKLPESLELKKAFGDRENIEIQFPKTESRPTILSAEEFEQVYETGDHAAIKKAIKEKAPLGDKIPTDQELKELNASVTKGQYMKAVYKESKSDGTTEIRYAFDGLVQTVVYDANGNMKTGQIKTLDKYTGLRNVQVDYFINKKGQKCWIF